MSFYLAIVSPLDTPLFEVQFTSARQQPQAGGSSSASSFPSWSTFTGANGSDLGAGEGQRQLGVNLGLAAGQAGGAGEKHLLQMIAHASLDAVEEASEGTGNLCVRLLGIGLGC